MLPNTPIDAKACELVPRALQHRNQLFVILYAVLIHQRKPIPKLANCCGTIPALLEWLKLKTNTNSHNQPPAK